MKIEQAISAPQRAILKSTKAMNLFLGGVGSGKTYLLGIKTYQLIRRFPEMRGFIGANTVMQLTQSTLFRIREYWKSIGILEYDKHGCPHGQYIVNKQPPPHFKTDTHSFDSYYNIISFINGCVIFIGSLENSAAHSGKEMAWAVLDETWDTREEDVKEIILARIRQRGIYMVNGEMKSEGKPEEQFNPLYIVTSPAKVEWINKLFCLDDYIEEINDKIYSDKTFFHKEYDNKCAVISSTFHNIHNVGENYIKNVLNNNSEQRGLALIYACPFATTGGEFASSFNRLKHVGKVKYDSNIAIHISFDQNAVPYNSASIWQVARGKDDIWDLRGIDEIALQNPRNSTEEVCEEFIRRYPDHAAGLFYYGDASGHARTTMNKNFKHHYEIIDFKLRKYLNNKSDRSLRSNPSVIGRRDFLNKILEEKLPIRVLIDESMKYTIADMLYCKQALDGGKDKSIVTDKETKEKYQKYGHFLDNFEYLIVELFRNYY